MGKNIDDEKQREGRRNLILRFEDFIQGLNGDEMPEKDRHDMEELFWQLIEGDWAFAAFIGCRQEHWEQRAQQGERGAQIVMNLISRFDAKNGKDAFKKRVMLYTLQHRTYEEAFPELLDNEELKRDYTKYIDDAVEEGRQAVLKRLREDLEKEILEADEKEKKSKARLDAWAERSNAREEIVLPLFGMIVSGLFGAAALAHWALKNGWHGPQNVFLEVVFPFLMVAGSVVFAAFAVGFLLVHADPGIAGLGYFLGGAAAIAFLLFWKYRWVCLGVQILVAALFAAHLIILIVKIAKCLKLRAAHRRAGLMKWKD